MTFEQSVRQVIEEDIEGLIEAKRLYGDSWREQGGFSAFFNVQRKADRFKNLAARPTATIPANLSIPGFGTPFVRERYDLFGHIEADIRTGGEAMLDCVRDLRRYLTLVEAYIVEIGVELPLSRDNLAVAKRREEGEKLLADLLSTDREDPCEDLPFIQISEPNITYRPKVLGPRGFDPKQDLAFSDDGDGV